MSTNTNCAMQTPSEHGAATDFDTTTETLVGMPTCELMEHDWNSPEMTPLTVALLARLESYAQEMERLEDELRGARGLPHKQPGKVVDRRTGQTLE